jgi:hypothetical protein
MFTRITPVLFMPLSTLALNASAAPAAAPPSRRADSPSAPRKIKFVDNGNGQVFHFTGHETNYDTFPEWKRPEVKLDAEWDADTAAYRKRVEKYGWDVKTSDGYNVNGQIRNFPKSYTLEVNPDGTLKGPAGKHTVFVGYRNILNNQPLSAIVSQSMTGLPPYNYTG